MPGIQQFDTTMRLLQKVLDLRAKNQEIIGGNIANAETPGYAAQSFNFEQQLQTAVTQGGLQPATTQNGHMAVNPAHFDQVTGTVTVDRDRSRFGDQNTVSVDQEMIKLAENEILYEAAVTMLNKKLSLIKYAANGGA